MRKKTAKWSLLLSVSIIMSLLLTSVSSANVDGILSSTLSSEEGEIVAVYIAEDGVLTEISKEEYAVLVEQRELMEEIKEIAKSKELDQQKREFISNLPNQNKTTDANIMSSYYWWGYKYDEIGFNNLVVDTARKRRITNPIYNSGTNPAPYVMSGVVTETFTSNVSITLSAKKTAVTAGASVGAAWSETVTGTFSLTPNVSSGKWGWLEFTPYQTNSWGWLRTTHYLTQVPGTTIPIETTSEWYDIYSPKSLQHGTLGTIPDGEYIIKESSTIPTS